MRKLSTEPLRIGKAGRRVEQRYGRDLRMIVLETMTVYETDADCAQALGVHFNTFTYWRRRLGIPWRRVPDEFIATPDGGAGKSSVKTCVGTNVEPPK